SLDFFVNAYTRTTDSAKYHGIKQDVMLKIIDIIVRHGAECAFPTSAVQPAMGKTAASRPPDG
ncbi:MAG: mechanosensitive ion channel family protein, partial [Gammaproteobacteria bacterium]